MKEIGLGGVRIPSTPFDRPMVIWSCRPDLVQYWNSNVSLISHKVGVVMLPYLTQCRSDNAVLISHNVGVVMLS